MDTLRRNKIYISIAAISFVQGLQYCVSPILGQLQSYYSTVDVSLVQMLVTAPALLAMAVALVSGWLVLRVSKKKLLIFASFVAGAVGFLPFLHDSFTLLFLSRILFGISLGLTTALNTAVVADFFEGDARVVAMGVQAASVGTGMILVTGLSGILGDFFFKYSYFVNVIGFIAMGLIALCLPNTGRIQLKQTEKIKLNARVYTIAVFGLLEFFFLISFSTNIAMHLGGVLKGNVAVSGMLTGAFSGVQIVVGLLLGRISKLTGKYTMPVAIASFSVGALLLVLFPSSVVMLLMGALFCGVSQGMFIPQAMVDVSNAVPPVATTMAVAYFTCASCIGQIISPMVLNGLSKVLFGQVQTGAVYLIAMTGTLITAVMAVIWKKRQEV